MFSEYSQASPAPFSGKNNI